ncbi:hypothetical protein [Rhizobium sp. SSA_523]|uniref:hypothetical protein n=1 Tax=Rhizobium sp. SSA_523 TaxID=2952477 RepID=UPI00209046C7|nr:hypothetical protein [Rhizobium sp. SSA_523]MCO5733673.1 hypothetical protein [Rhizobium sp. SSA_523]WKC23035.1 hypothetical protein QTJ18_19685 [Rhizobium sp. SSA_523]
MHAFRSRRDNAAAAYDILPPEVLGSGRRPRSAEKAEIEDAHFVTLREDTRAPLGASHSGRFENDNLRRPRRVHSPGQMRGQRSAGTALSRLASLAGRLPHGWLRRLGKVSLSSAALLMGLLVGRLEAALMRMSADFFSALVAFVFVIVFGLCGGFSLISAASSAPVTGKGLDITHVTLTPQDANGLRVLVINGIVENRSQMRMPVMSIQAELLTGGRTVARAVIAPPVAQLAADHSRGFSARLPHPGGSDPSLRLSFAETGASSD